MVYDKNLYEELLNIAENQNKLAGIDDDDFEFEKPKRKKFFGKRSKKAQIKDNEEEKSL